MGPKASANFWEFPNRCSEFFRVNHESMAIELAGDFQGADIKVVQELLRHASRPITLDTYTQAVTEQKRAARNKIAGLVRGLKSLTQQIRRTHRHSSVVRDLKVFLRRFESVKELRRVVKVASFFACEISAKLIVSR